MGNQRLINCDFFNKGEMKISNKARLLYFTFLVNADDKGFVGNGVSIAKEMDQREEETDNTLFSFKYVDALKELVDQNLCYMFKNKVGNVIFLIRHWFLHNKYQKFLTTNYVSCLAQVELIDGEYHLKNPYKGKEIKQINKLNEINISNDSNNLIVDSNNDTNWEKEWEKTIKDINSFGKEN